MARPPAPAGSYRSPAKHQAILMAATEIFLGEGYDRTSVDSIASAAGVSKQTIYGHFGDKHGLFLAVIAEAQSKVGVGPDDLATLVIDTGDARADLELAGERLVRAINGPDVEALFRLTIGESTRHPELQGSWPYDKHFQAITDVFAAYLDECRSRGELDVPDPQLMARQFVLLLSSEAEVQSQRGVRRLSTDQIQAITRDTVDLMIRSSCR